jgi:hypothetical protein
MRDNKKRYSKETCYACSLKAVTKEHVPPKVFFPEKKDLPLGHPDMRKNLIRVPSCKIHNLEKSEDDFYAFSIIVSSFDTTYIAQHQFSKYLRAAHRKPALFSFLKNEESFPVIVNGKLSGSTPVDTSRFDKFLFCLSKGIYYRHFEMKWENNFYVFPLSLKEQPDSKDNNWYNEKVASIRKDMSSFFTDSEKFGANPEVFYYQIFQEPNDDVTVLRMIFYGGFEIIASEEKE